MEKRDALIMPGWAAVVVLLCCVGSVFLSLVAFARTTAFLERYGDRIGGVEYRLQFVERDLLRQFPTGERGE